MPLYHFAPLKLGVGSVIEPGNWGRLLGRYGQPEAGGGVFGRPWVLARELIFEGVRKALNNAPALPSRFLASFAVDEWDAATRYQQANDPSGKQIAHIVELVDEALPTHVGLLARLDLIDTTFLPYVTAQAEAYWAGEGDGDRELVTLSGLRVIGHP